MRRVKRPEIFSNPGDPVHILYAPSVSSSGAVTLEPCGAENTDDFIQSHVRSTDIQMIMSRVRQGEIDLLNKRPGSYGDFTQMPQTYAEVLQLQINARNLFGSLPSDIRRKFDNDPDRFLAEAGSLSWFENIKDVIPSEVLNQIMPSFPVVSNSVESEVVSSES